MSWELKVDQPVWFCAGDGRWMRGTVVEVREKARYRLRYIAAPRYTILHRRNIRTEQEHKEAVAPELVKEAVFSKSDVLELFCRLPTDTIGAIGAAKLQAMRRVLFENGVVE